MFNAWQQHQAVQMTCMDKWQETPDTVSIKLTVPSQPTTYTFKPGQFVSLGAEINGKTQYRAYSLSSVPGEDHLQLTIKRVDNGLVSNHIVDHLNIGDTVSVLKPAGEFNCIDFPPKKNLGEKTKVLLVSAGCGITPVYSMATFWLQTQQDIEIDFLHVAKDKAQTIYLDQLETLNALHDNFSLKLLLKESGDAPHPQGRLNQAWLTQLVPDIHSRSVYLCGPASFMTDVRSYLVAEGVNLAHFHEESFSPSDENVIPRFAPENSGEHTDTAPAESGVQVHIPAFGQTVETQLGQTLADVLEDAGLPIIVACRSGVCGSCKCKVSAGHVASTSQETLTEEEIAQGYVLACSSTLSGDINIEL
ncbi:hybrid-cluster NAD(P)-dependent oxidoreductase [Enterovibrio sp. ZSDZ42]|uniref:Hybrid-cluster NAD(P)-dependent oxidoreductase n=1 Tax=Enterovibrio gelatinilyticus TaxID=2899819 RepID=A0ABT5QZ20_9GAMM|nr:hybrid-cluster NAD(P)-dependent oxidoreductase [Enterovibrio sp. ZSDZ42]MDD1793246.1 hybrid-cluster NAD(P)-dependent oxidoreductase [Enterovibrio sp. ZSDZ42]